MNDRNHLHAVFLFFRISIRLFPPFYVKTTDNFLYNRVRLDSRRQNVFFDILIIDQLIYAKREVKEYILILRSLF